ncbi:E3 ubiquitin-protein ligase SDIR1 [Platanthera zijinensis]|uniref:E3 ubiquitin-protein ligase SDIR1 n=1 Tax=Platanthera zijinensis TaxID=2320716 RepID=A0AAP0BET9_9ASPA
MDLEMLMEIPDTPERAAFTHSVGESSSHTLRTKDKPSSSNQYLEPTAGTSSCQMKNSTLYDFSGHNAAPLDDDILFQQSRINGVGITHSAESSSDGDGASPEMIDLSQESVFSVRHPTGHRGPRHKERKNLSRQSEKNEIFGYGKPGVHDFSDVNTVPLDGDFLFSQASIARSISGTHDTRTKHSHDSSPEPGRSGVSISPKMIDLNQRSPFPVPHPTRHRGSRHREEKYLRRQSGRNEKRGFDKIGVRALISSADFRKERSNASNSSNDFGSSNDTELESVRCHGMVRSSHKEEVVQKRNSRTRNEQLQLRNPEFSFQQSIIQQNKLSNGCMSPFDITNTSNNGQVKEDCKEIKNPTSQIASSSPVRNKVTETGNEYCKVSQSTGEADHNHINKVLNPKKNERRMLVRNGCISPSNIAQNKTVTKDKGIEEGGVSGKMPDSNSTKSTRVDVDLHPKNNGHRTVVQNGCAFPSHTAENRNEGGVIPSKIPNGNSSKLAHSSNFECRGTDKMKGKRIMNEELTNSQHYWNIPTSRRSCLLPGKELPIISDMDSDTGRTGHTTGICAIESVSSHLSSSRVEISKGRSLSVAEKPEVATLQSGENSTQVHGSFKLDSEVPQHTGKRKNSFTHSNTGECSSSTIASSSILCDRRSTRPLNSRTTRSRKSVRIDIALPPIVEIDELDCSTTEDNQELSDESIAKSIQLESDEILARQLQEQFYLESPPVGAAEVESTIERSLLQEEENLHASLRRQNHSYQREALLPSLFGQPIFHHPSTRTATRARARSIGRIRRNFSRPSMSMEERIDFLEALEAAFENADMETPDRFLDGQRDFDENDYEMLLALDENNHHVGASERQINNLPQSLIQQITDSEEACAVCLENPSVGDTIRHLPCLHKFHKDCIDTWLRRKRSCPICKCGIT